MASVLAEYLIVDLVFQLPGVSLFPSISKVWEHAYYIDYRNLRAAYIGKFYGMHTEEMYLGVAKRWTWSIWYTLAFTYHHHLQAADRRPSEILTTKCTFSRHTNIITIRNFYINTRTYSSQVHA